MKRGCLLTVLCLLLTCIPLSILILSADIGVAGTVVPEVHYTSDKNWTMGGSPYFIEGHVFVEEGYNLTIEPGAEVRFNGYYSLNINGRLMAIGDPEKRITITSNNSIPEEWITVQINGTGSADIKYCDISYASSAVTVNGSSDVVIQYNEIYSNYNGVDLYSSQKVTVSHNNITNNENTGIFLRESDENDISNNNISDNGWHGVHLFRSAYNVIMSNTIYNNRRGVYCAGSAGNRTMNNEIKYNWITENIDGGIRMLSFANNNTISNNNISLNADDGIFLSGNVNNQIYHNTLWSNSNQAVDETASNSWDDGYPNGGNFWSDYTGIDEKRGANQDVPGSDDLGDEVYIIDNNSMDRYPLMNKSRNLAPFLIALVSPLNNSVILAGTVIDLDILLDNPSFVNYSLDGGASSTTIFFPHDIYTSVWGDGPYNVTVDVVDGNGGVNSSYFLFTVDSSGPEIVLVSPLNNSMFAAGNIIDFDIVEPNINSAVYRINNGSTENLMYPYDFNTSAWPDGEYSIEIHADDVAGNANISLFSFTVDSNPPSIVLTNPANISYIRPGTIINFSIADDHLASANYSVNSGIEQPFDVEYIINTTSFSDGPYTLRIVAEDELGNSNFQEYNVTVDSIAPEVILNSPQNNSMFKAGTILNFSVFDTSPFVFTYLERSGNEVTVYSPYRINTSSWQDGTYPIFVNVTDYAGNTITPWYNFTVDSLEPQITGTIPQNNSFVQPGSLIVVNIYETNLAFARFSANGGSWEDLTPHMVINTSGWQDGRYEVEVYVEDNVGNNVSDTFIFHIDGIPPKISETTPKDNEFGVDTKTSIRIRFSEPMVQQTVNFGITTSPMFNFTYSWNLENTTLIITPKEYLADDTRYTIVINSTAMDGAGNLMGEDYEFSFETGEAANWSMWILFIITCILVVAIVLTYLFLRKEKKKGGIEDEDAEGEFDLEEEPGPKETETEVQDIDEELLEEGEEEGETGEAADDVEKDQETGEEESEEPPEIQD
jgi:parallel beta-helix repeat protein